MQGCDLQVRLSYCGDAHTFTPSTGVGVGGDRQVCGCVSSKSARVSTARPSLKRERQACIDIPSSFCFIPFSDWVESRGNSEESRHICLWGTVMVGLHSWKSDLSSGRDRAATGQILVLYLVSKEAQSLWWPSGACSRRYYLTG